MNKAEIKTFLETFSDQLLRTIVIIDFGNVEKWKESLGWKIGIQELGRLSRSFSKGNISLRRFYYGSDYGPKEKSQTLSFWSNSILSRAKFNRFEVVDKRVKYIHNTNNTLGYDKKCDLDVEMTVDLIQMREDYDNIVFFSGDGDLVYAFKYLKENFRKNIYVFGARNHIGREIVDGLKEGVIKRLLYAEDFEYRLNMERFRYK